MYKINDYLVYKKDVCRLIDIRKNKLTDKECYVLIPLREESLKIEVPIEYEKNTIRSVMSKEEANLLIKKIPSIEPIKDIDDKMIEKIYKELLNNGNREDLVKIIKTTYLRNDSRIKNHKKVNDKDKNYFEKAEEYLYLELSISLDLSYEKTKEYIIKQVQELTNEKNTK